MPSTTAYPILIESGSVSSCDQSPKLRDTYQRAFEEAGGAGEVQLKEDLADAMLESPGVRDAGRFLFWVCYFLLYKVILGEWTNRRVWKLLVSCVKFLKYQVWHFQKIFRNCLNICALLKIIFSNRMSCMVMRFYINRSCTLLTMFEYLKFAVCHSLKVIKLHQR